VDEALRVAHARDGGEGLVAVALVLALEIEKGNVHAPSGARDLDGPVACKADTCIS
jgi:hypothetical protein